MVHSLALDVLPEEFVVTQLPATASVPAWVWTATGLVAVTRTDEELSIVVAQPAVPREVPGVGPWKALKVRGPLDFELTGILAALGTTLADAGISLFAISTYNTDYILVRSQTLTAAIAALRNAGHDVLHQARTGRPQASDRPGTASGEATSAPSN
jgi:hypothetical protein